MPSSASAGPRRLQSGERGAALLAVLATVVLLAALTSLGLSRLKSATTHLDDTSARHQVMLLAESGVTAARFLVFKLKTAAHQPNAKRPESISFALADGRITLRFSSAGNCFNLNAMAPAPTAADQPPLPPQARAEDFRKLLAAAGIDATQAATLAEATATRLAQDGMLWADGSEWATVRGVSAAHWQKAGHLLCALPNREQAALDINALTVADVPLLAASGVPVDVARRMLASRPQQGWASPTDFWQQAMVSPPPNNAGAQSLRTDSRWMLVEVEATTARLRHTRQILLDTVPQPAHIAAVTWKPLEPPPPPEEAIG